MRFIITALFMAFFVHPSTTFAGGPIKYKEFIYESNEESLLIKNTITGQIVTLDVGPVPGPMCIDHERKIGYIMSHGELSVSLIDLETNVILRTIHCSNKSKSLKSQSM